MEPFTLPPQGGGMCHSNPELTGYIRVQPPTSVDLKWHREKLIPEKLGSLGNGVAGNGDIVACTFLSLRDSLIVYDYDGNRVWSSGDILNWHAMFSVPMVDVHGRVITCDDEKIIMIDTNTKEVVWQSSLLYGGTPYSPTITEDGTIIVATDKGPVYAFDSTDGSLLAWKFLGDDELVRWISYYTGIDDPGFFSTVNTPSVKGNRVYVTTKYKNRLGLSTIREDSRLYALDIDPTKPIDERITVAWSWHFNGSTTASPTLVGDTVYFDVVPSRFNKYIVAITDAGDHPKLKWKVSYDYITYASFTYDPRGGMWYVDPFNQRIVRFSYDDGSIMETININDTLKSEYKDPIPRLPLRWGPRVPKVFSHLPWLPLPVYYNYGYYSSSPIVMCGTDTNPILIVGAGNTRPVYHTSSYVLAFDLSNNNELLWKFKIHEGVFNPIRYPIFGLKFLLGLATIMVKDNEPRVVFGTALDGVYSIG